LENIIVELSKYLLIILVAVYTYLCFGVFGIEDPYRKNSMLTQQSVVMFMIQIVAFGVMFLQTGEKKMLIFYGMQFALFLATIILYVNIYPKVSRLVVNNMCMLLCIGMIMLTRLNYSYAMKQFLISACAVAGSLVVPVIIRKMTTLAKLRWIYALIGLASLGAVFVAGRISYGAKLGFEIMGISIQPSELVKIVFVFFVAASFRISTSFKNVVLTSAIAAAHVLILVASTDLGSALIIVIVYIVMLYVATKQWVYLAAGIVGGAGASYVGYKLFSHVKTRVEVWRDPFALYETGGYQVAQSLFAIGTGSWFGMGLFKGAPQTIPVVEKDFIFSAISEEMGLIFAICTVLICVSCYVMILNIAMELRRRFYKYIALGLGTCYIFQVFLTVGGAVKFIPSTGVTLPFVSYGGSSILSTFIMFAIIQGLYIVREDEEEDIERKKEERLRAQRSIKRLG